jgi:hypothetical protein
MNVEIGAEAALFPEKEDISGIFVEVQVIPADDLLAAKLNSSYTEILAAYCSQCTATAPGTPGWR